MRRTIFAAMNTTLEYNKKHIRKPLGFMLIFCAIPVFILVWFFDYGDKDISVYQIYFGYMWFWYLGLAIYWHRKKVLNTPFHYVLFISGLIFNGLFVLFLPYFYSDSFTSLFWK